MPREEQRRDLVKRDRFPTFDLQAPGPVSVRSGDDWLQPFMLEGVAHLHNSLAGSTVPGSYCGDDVQYSHERCVILRGGGSPEANGIYSTGSIPHRHLFFFRASITIIDPH